MKAQLQREAGNDLNFCSSKNGDRWFAFSGASSYQWWHFDAVSDDGSEVISIRFYDNCFFIKDYWRKGRTAKIPAVTFSYLNSSGKKHNVIKSFSADELHASEERPECGIGNCSFFFNDAEYGSGYYVKIDLDLPGGKKLTAGLEWLLVESDLKPQEAEDSIGHCWNVAGFRADVSGRFRITDKKGKCIESRNFRGTGYHDHKRDVRCPVSSIESIHWGRVHFADSTAVFHRHTLNMSEPEPVKLLIYKQENLRELVPVYEEQGNDYRLLGRNTPSRIRLVTDENIRLRVKPVRIIRQNFFETSWLSEMTLTLRDGVPRRSFGITEYSKPGNFNKVPYKWLAKFI